MPIGGNVRDVRPDPVLTRLAVELGQGGAFAADRIAPVATVANDQFKYATWGQEEIKDDVKTTRAPGASAAEVELSKTYSTGSVEYHSLTSRIPDEIRNNDPNPASLESRRTRVLTGKLRLGIEKRIAALLAAATKTHTTPNPKWDATNATIRKDILNAKQAFRRNSGMNPNVIVIPPAVSVSVFNDTNILELLKYTQGNLLADGMIPKIEGMEVIVPGTIKDTSNPGAAASIADVWASDEVYYLYVDPQAGNDLGAQTALRQVRSMATTGQPFSVRRWRDPDVSANSDMVTVECNQDEIVLSQAMILRHLDILT